MFHAIQTIDEHPWVKAGRLDSVSPASPRSRRHLRLVIDAPAVVAPAPTVSQDIVSSRLFGFDFISCTELETIVDQLAGLQPTDGLLPLVLTPNADYMVRLDEPHMAEFAAALKRSRYVLPDGQPIVWTSRLLGSPLPARIPGSTVFPLLWNRVVASQRPVVVVASDQQTADGLALEHPKAAFVVPPMFDAHDPIELGEVVNACRKAIVEVGADFVFIGISFPKQQLVALAVIDELEAAGEPVPLFLTLGASFEMHLGRHRRAPMWMQAAGLEWFFRFLLEPRRLFRRYFVNDPQFVRLMVREVRNARRLARSARSSR